MNYEDFKARIYSMVREEFDSDTEVTLKPVRKNNGVVLDGITIMPEGSCIAPTIYINQYYERYREGLSLEAIVRIILEENRHYSFDYPLDVDEFLKYDRLKERIRFRLVNYSMNEELLSDVPYVKFLDLAKIYYYEIRTFCGGRSPERSLIKSRMPICRDLSLRGSTRCGKWWIFLPMARRMPVRYLTRWCLCTF